MARAYWKKHVLHFKLPSGTSRGILQTKTSYFFIWEDDAFQYPALGECSLIQGLSPDPLANYEMILDDVCDWLNGKAPKTPDLTEYPSIKFGLEMLSLDRESKGLKHLFPSDFTHENQGILINGLIWMGNKDSMSQQIIEKIEQGFACVKLKIGAIDFNAELDLLKFIRSEFDSSLELRVDANGAFSSNNALEKLNQLSDFNIHSIEQPIQPNQWSEMAQLCSNTPIPIALDEEIIGVHNADQKRTVLETINPHYIILKPSLIGGFESANEWIDLSEERNIEWWATSALESNIGLNAIAQYTATKDVHLPQGLGTGGLFTNNLDSPLYLQGQMLHFNPNQIWNLEALEL